MKTVLLDDEPLSLAYLSRLCTQLRQLDVVAAFSDSAEALQYLSAHEVELLISDIEMPGLSGMEMTRRLRADHPQLGVIFITGYEEYALQAFQMEAAAYIVKPCSLDALQNAVKRASLLAQPSKRVFIRTFGYFSVLIDNVPIRFSNSKAKELLALLVDRSGAVVTMEQAADVLWEERPYDDMVKRLYRKAVSYLHQVFQDTGFFVSERGSCHIVPAQAECDYFKLLDTPSAARTLYHGEYLLDYSWGEHTNGKILQMLNAL